MWQTVDTKEPNAVEQEVGTLFRRMYPEGDPAFVPQAFQWAIQCFSGQCEGYQAIDARYHDLEHTLQGTLCLTRLLYGRHQSGIRPLVTEKEFRLVLAAILFHDTGYLKTRDDTAGTGAKYTPIHVGRSTVFAAEFLTRKGWAPSDITAVQHMIRCTGLKAEIIGIPFQSEQEKMLGCALATADMLGQMSAPDYVDKLPVLFLEFAEAAKSGYDLAGRFAGYATAEDLVRRTRDFWKNYAWPRLNSEFMGLYKFLNDPYPDGPNPYLQRIEQNLARIEETRAGKPGSRS